MNRETVNRIQISELRLEAAPAPVLAPAPAPAPQPEEPAAEVALVQFAPEECIAGAMEEGETFSLIELEPGVTGITCKRAPDGPAEVQVLKFDPMTFDDASAKAWAESNEFLAWTKRVAGRHAFAAVLKIRMNESRFEELAPGEIEDPDAPKFSEGMETFRIEVQKAIDEKGWSVFTSMDPAYDFVIQELWPDRVLVIDTLTGGYFSLRVGLGSDGTVTLADPVPAEITVSVPDTADPVPAAASTSPVLRNTGTQALVASRQGGEPGKGTALYRVLLCQGGWTRDQRYITDDCLREAVTLGKFDGAKCWYGHPEPQADGRRSRLAVGFVKPGTVTIEKNRAGHVDIWGDVALMRSTGAEIQEFLDQSLEIGVPLLGASVYCPATENSYQNIDGRQAQVFTKFLSEKVAVDFVDDPAFPRARATERLAASATDYTGDQLTMDEKKRLEKAERENAELKAEALLRKRETLVNAELAATGWPAEFIAAQKPVLLEIEKAPVRAAHIATMNMVLGKKTGIRTGATAGATDSGISGDSRLSPAMQAQLAKISKSRGWKPEALENAEKTAFRS
uniref:Uncharacterized protein n=1 Tax=viral metagenome TaxID=1070528 RepID=A0A6M3JD17_9ZZZZ